MARNIELRAYEHAKRLRILYAADLLSREIDQQRVKQAAQTLEEASKEIQGLRAALEELRGDFVRIKAISDQHCAYEASPPAGEREA